MLVVLEQLGKNRSAGNTPATARAKGLTNFMSIHKTL
jgi:hypothetical protein